ncbi:putative phosphosugar-binding protein [Evansella vedderi]|uniref:Phosphosugar-binding protein n=1 Tax=Evansella vedderi TaxID=38282 RepID=A0ABU0A3W3_9BACI|nr:DUF2529 family protein [Evansella vedderi]MDQ0257378.1 putative phosphosugar-binding protein [Evansella vedderi]
MKIFQTQLQGLINKLGDHEDVMEDAARVMAQSIISDGHLWIFAEKDMRGVLYQATEGADSLPSVEAATKESSFSPMDCLLVFSSDLGSTVVSELIKRAQDNGVQVIGVSSTGDDDGVVMCSFHIPTGIKRGLVPTDDGGRMGEPHLLMALHIYYSLFFTVKEILEEYELGI